MRVLVIHDRPEIMEEIAGIVLDKGGSRCVIDRARDLVTGRDRFREHHYDLAIVDLTIPVVETMSDTTLQHADWLLTEAFAGLELKTPADVIAISKDGEAVRGIRTRIGEHVLAVITEDPDGLWRSQVSEKLTYVLNTRRSRMLAANSTYDLEVAIITALDKEAHPYHKLLELERSEELSNTWEFTLRSIDEIDLRCVLTSVGRSGQAPAAATTQAVLTQFRPRVILMTGFCGGVESKLALGDVAAFASAAPWDYGKWTEATNEKVPKFLPRSEAVPIEAGCLAQIVRDLESRSSVLNPAVQRRMQELSGGKVTSSIIKSVAAGSGSSVVTSENMLGRIVETNDAIHAIDMESHGFYYACRHTPVVRPDYLCIKGVADYCNGFKDDALHAVCSELSARVALEILRERYDFGS